VHMFRNFFKRTPPLKDTLDDSILRLSQQKRKLELLSQRIRAREASLFRSCTEAMNRRDSDRARIYANEIAEVKKECRIVNSELLRLEQIILRLDTLREIGSAFAQLEPTLEVVKEIAARLSEVMPEVSNEISHIGSTLDDAMIAFRIDAGSGPDYAPGPAVPRTAAGGEILEEASKVLRERLEEDLPAPPLSIACRRAVALGGDGDEEGEYEGEGKGKGEVEVVKVGSGRGYGWGLTLGPGSGSKNSVEMREEALLSQLLRKGPR